MPDYLVESYEPRGGGQVPVAVAGLRHRRSIYVPDDELALHVFGAASLGAVRDALERAAFRYERIVEAVEREAPDRPSGRRRIARAADDGGETAAQAPRQTSNDHEPEGNPSC